MNFLHQKKSTQIKKYVFFSILSCFLFVNHKVFAQKAPVTETVRTNYFVEIDCDQTSLENEGTKDSIEVELIKSDGISTKVNMSSDTAQMRASRVFLDDIDRLLTNYKTSQTTGNYGVNLSSYDLGLNIIAEAYN